MNFLDVFREDSIRFFAKELHHKCCIHTCCANPCQRELFFREMFLFEGVNVPAGNNTSSADEHELVSVIVAFDGLLKMMEKSYFFVFGDNERTSETQDEDTLFHSREE